MYDREINVRPVSSHAWSAGDVDRGDRVEINFCNRLWSFDLRNQGGVLLFLLEGVVDYRVRTGSRYVYVLASFRVFKFQAWGSNFSVYEEGGVRADFIRPRAAHIIYVRFSDASAKGLYSGCLLQRDRYVQVDF